MSALVTKDRVVETTTTTGTGALSLSGPLIGYQAFADVCAIGDTCYYVIEAIDSNGVPTGDWETGLGTYSAAGTLTRTTVHASSNAGAAVNLATGNKRVMIAVTNTFLSNFSTGGSLEAYSAQSSADLAVSPVPAPVTAIPGMTLTIPASTVARTFMVNAMVTWNQNHGMRGTILVDGSNAFPSGAHLQINPVVSGDGAYFLIWAGVLLAIPGEGAEHTIAAAWAAQSSTSGVTIQERTICALKVA